MSKTKDNRTTLLHTFKHSWHECTLASWMKYPNPDRPDVLSVDLINKDYDEKTGILRATRLIMMDSWIPSWIRFLTGGSNVCFFLEESITDPVNKRLILRGKNFSFSQIVSMEETCVYTQSEESDEWTLFEQSAKVTAHPWGPVAGKLEKFCVDQFVRHSQRGKEIMESTIRRVKELTLSPAFFGMNLSEMPNDLYKSNKFAKFS